jgi:hypothetical protein
VSARVFVTETLGFRNTLVADAGAQLIRAFCPPEVVWRTGDGVWFDIGEHNFHLFADALAVAHPTTPVDRLDA